jgi:hypothetical protein
MYLAARHAPSPNSTYPLYWLGTAHALMLTDRDFKQ